MRPVIIGTGAMASAYFDAMAALGVSVDVVGNSELGCQRFEDRHQVEVFRKGLSEYLPLRKPLAAVLCASIAASPSLCKELVRAQVPLVLAEKPLVLSTHDYKQLRSQLGTSTTKLYVALNRRFIDSVSAAKKALSSDREEFHMSITFGERVSRVAHLPHPKRVLSRWIIANAIHVFDTAFFIAGEPALTSSKRFGSLPWHPSGASFVGRGTISSESTKSFDYLADWREEGSWKIEFTSASSSIILNPLETASFYRNSELLRRVNTEPDPALKPGLLEMCRDFLGPRKRVQDFKSYGKTISLLEQVGGYPTRLS